jgi:hypothetical protein
VDYVKALFSAKGLVIVVYILIGVFVNTSPPPFADCSVQYSGAS